MKYGYPTEIKSFPQKHLLVMWLQQLEGMLVPCSVKEVLELTGTLVSWESNK